MPRVQGIPDHSCEAVPAATNEDSHIGVCLGKPIHIWHILCFHDLCIQESSWHLHRLPQFRSPTARKRVYATWTSSLATRLSSPHDSVLGKRWQLLARAGGMHKTWHISVRPALLVNLPRGRRLEQWGSVNPPGRVYCSRTLLRSTRLTNSSRPGRKLMSPPCIIRPYESFGCSRNDTWMAEDALHG